MTYLRLIEFWFANVAVSTPTERCSQSAHFHRIWIWKREEKVYIIILRNLMSTEFIFNIGFKKRNYKKKENSYGGWHAVAWPGKRFLSQFQFLCCWGRIGWDVPVILRIFCLISSYLMFIPRNRWFWDLFSITIIIDFSPNGSTAAYSAIIIWRNPILFNI